MSVERVAPNANEEQLHVSIGGEAPRVFGTMTRDVQALVQWLLEREVRSVAMEATGVYWNRQPEPRLAGRSHDFDLGRDLESAPHAGFRRKLPFLRQRARRHDRKCGNRRATETI
jgi:hypothetical protein